MAFDFKINIDEQYPFEFDHTNKRVSPQCLKKTKRVQTGRIYFITICLICMIFPILYLIPSSNTKIQLTIDPNAYCSNFVVHSYSINDSAYHNLSMTSIDWTIESIEVGFNPFIYPIKNRIMVQHLLYDQSITDFGIDISRLNSLKVPLFTAKNEIDNTIDNASIGSMNDLNVFYIIPTDYVLSYLKITIVSNNQDLEQFSIDFYHFFYEDQKIDLKYGMVSQLILRSLSFNLESYTTWYNWKYLNSSFIPTDYPYTINVDIRRYNLLTNIVGIYSI